MNNYKYPDNSDKLTTLYIDNKSNSIYWSESEKNVLNKIISRINSLDIKPDFLDLGCGLGRLFSVFIPHVNSITGLEPDNERFLHAKKEAENLNYKNIQVFNDNISLVAHKKYMATLVSHVFQHIPLDSTNEILKTLNDIIPAGGLLFITTTFTSQENDIFTLEYLKNDEWFSEKVSEADFIKRFTEEGVLPVRLFSYNTMNSLFENNNFIIEDIFAYHFKVSEIDAIPDVKFDENRNNQKLYSGAKDVLYILRKKDKS